MSGTETLTITDDQRGLVADALRWRTIGLCFERPRAGTCETLQALALEVGDVELADLARKVAASVTAEQHLAVFGPGGTVSPREISYHRMGDPGHLLARLKTMYESFAFDPVTEESPDHVSVECGFVGYLRLKESFARVMGRTQAAEAMQNAAKVFVSEHLSVLAAGLAAKLELERHGPLAVAAGVLESSVGPVPEPVVRAARAAACSGQDWDACLKGCPFDTEA